MLDIARDFETTAPGLGAAVVVPAVVLVAAGIIAWLTGSALRRQLSAVAGAIGGAIAGFFIFGGGLPATIACSITAAILAAGLERLFSVVLTTALALAVTLSILAVYSGHTKDIIKHPPIPLNDGTVVTVRPAPDTLVQYAAALAERTAGQWMTVPLGGRITAAVITGAFALAAVFFPRLASAMCWSTVGTTFIFAGMIMLLAYKGSNPISNIAGRGLFYTAIFGAMTWFGTAEQIVLCRGCNKEPRKKQERDIRGK